MSLPIYEISFKAHTCFQKLMFLIFTTTNHSEILNATSWASSHHWEKIFLFLLPFNLL